MNQKTSAEFKPNANKPEEKTETVVELSPTEMPPVQRDLDSVREIIFGNQIRNYNARFQKIDRELEHLQRLIDERFTDLDSKLTHKVEALNTEISEGIRGIDRNLNERINQAISSKEKENQHALSTWIDTFVQEVQGKIDRINSNYATQIGELRDGMKHNYETLKTEIISQTDGLEATKLNRFALAESLIALGMRLKDKNLSDEFNTQIS
ncbi:hypothetical protein IH992_03160 [Candidatus Poribacteria bacterium]|nr:hypothetical protein [Candidatus Poribacteria bacterium]